MLIPKEVIEDIRARNDIVDLISSYVTLKRAGSNYSGLCPFHSEKTPSFTVFPATQSFYCFGCGAGGDAITFIMRSENLEYASAIEWMAKRSGITINTDVSYDGEIEKRRRVYSMNLAAAKYFRNCLFDSKLGSAGMEYLSGKRRLPTSVIKHFGLGFAPDGFGGLTDYMHGLGYSDGELVEAFLCGKSAKTGRTYDYFRNRVIFPIIDVSGNIIAFGGRVMDDSKPKYLNSSDTPGFKKSKNLFALNFARRNCSEQLILCEGYMDVIALHAAGFENAVATLGTALTVEQARMMARYTKQVVLSYDSDEAGQKATSRALGMLADVGLDVKVLKMKGAKDPDEFIKKYGRDEFSALLGNSRTVFDYKMDTVLSKYDITQPSEKISAASEMCDFISEIGSGVERDVYITSVAKKLDISREGLLNDVAISRKKKMGEYRNRMSREIKMSAMGIGDRINPDAAKNIKAAASEEAVIGMLLIYDEYRTGVLKGIYPISADDFPSQFNKKVFECIMELQKNGGFVFSMLGEYFNAEELGRIQSMEVKRRMLSENGSDVFTACIESLKNECTMSGEKGETDGISEIERLLEAKRKKFKKTEINS